MTGFFKDLSERCHNTLEALSAKRKKIILFGLAVLSGAACLAAAWVCLANFRHLDAEKDYLLGNFPALAQDPKWIEVQHMRRVLFPFVMLSGLLGLLLVVGAPIVYWYYRDD